MFFEKAPRPTQTFSGPIPTNLDSLLGGFEAAKYTGGGGETLELWLKQRFGNQY